MITTAAEIDSYQKSVVKKIEGLVVSAFCTLGDKCVEVARSRAAEDSWFDDTGNLRSSIGYVVVRNGIIIKRSSFEVVKQGSEGAAEGKKLANKLARSCNKDFALIVVAGIHYAEYVEAMDNRVVLTSAEALVRRQLPIMIKQLEKQVLR